MPFFIKQKDEGVLTITDERMTRFMITLEEGVELVWHVFNDMIGGEIYVKKIPSMKVTDIAKAVDIEAKQKIIGIRPGEKIHEEMISSGDAPYTYEYKNHYKILPSIYDWSKDKKRINNGKKVDENFTYSSENNHDWMEINTLKNWIKANNQNIGKI